MWHQEVGRRSFLAATTVAVSGLSAARGAVAAEGDSTAARSDSEWRNKQSGMAYRRLGKTNLMISEIVFGGLTIRTREGGWEFLETGIELGMNYIDTASAYNNQESEQAIAKMIDSPSKRERVFIATKTSAWNEETRPAIYEKIWAGLNMREQALVRAKIGAALLEQGTLEEYYLCNYGDWQITEAEKVIRDDVLEALYGARLPKEDRRQMTQKIIEEVEGSLVRLGTDHVDVLMGVHGAAHPAQLTVPELLEAAHRLKKDGKIRFFGASAHNDPAGILRGAAASQDYDMVMVAYNISNDKWVAPALEEAARSDLGIIAMKVARAVFPDRGGKVQPLPGLEEKLHALIPGDQHVAEKAYLWALQNPNVSACVSAITSPEMCRANAKVAGKKVALG